MARGYARSVAIAFRPGSMDCVVVERTPDRFRWTA
jgi:hypothetical protein